MIVRHASITLALICACTTPSIDDSNTLLLQYVNDASLREMPQSVDSRSVMAIPSLGLVEGNAEAIASGWLTGRSLSFQHSAATRTTFTDGTSKFDYYVIPSSASSIGATASIGVTVYAVNSKATWAVWARSSRLTMLVRRRYSS
jgi:hypothetical protein